MQKVIQFDVLSKNAEQRIVYGYANVIETIEGKPIVDLQRDVIFADDLEKAAANFLKEYRQGGEMHRGQAPNELIASVVLTRDVQKALGIPEKVLPVGWFVGFEVPSETFDKVKEGSRLMFSIEGGGKRHEVDL